MIHHELVCVEYYSHSVSGGVFPHQNASFPPLCACIIPALSSVITYRGNCCLLSGGNIASVGWSFRRSTHWTIKKAITYTRTSDETGKGESEDDADIKYSAGTLEQVVFVPIWQEYRQQQKYVYRVKRAGILRARSPPPDKKGESRVKVR